MNNITKKEFELMGISLYFAQRFEFLLYGLASHFSHLEEAKNNKNFKKLDPEKFLRGDISELRATLGQIVSVFGNKFQIKSELLADFLERRNTIVHRLWRYLNDRKKEAPFSNLTIFLITFIQDCEEWINILRGLLSIFTEAAWIQSKKTGDFVRSKQDARYVKCFEGFLRSRFISENLK